MENVKRIKCYREGARRCVQRWYRWWKQQIQRINDGIKTVAEATGTLLDIRSKQIKYIMLPASEDWKSVQVVGWVGIIMLLYAQIEVVKDAFYGQWMRQLNFVIPGFASLSLDRVHYQNYYYKSLRIWRVLQFKIAAKDRPNTQERNGEISAESLTLLLSAAPYRLSYHLKGLLSDW